MYVSTRVNVPDFISLEENRVNSVRVYSIFIGSLSCSRTTYFIFPVMSNKRQYVCVIIRVYFHNGASAVRRKYLHVAAPSMYIIF